MGYGGRKLGTEGSSVSEGSGQGAERGRKKAWEGEEHLRTLRSVRDLLARGPPAVVGAAGEVVQEEKAEEEWQEREGRLRQRETLQKFSHWICEERASRTLGGGRASCQDFGSFAGSSFRGSNGSEMCKTIYDRERQRCKLTNGTTMANHHTPMSRQASRPTTAPRNQRTF